MTIRCSTKRPGKELYRKSGSLDTLKVIMASLSPAWTRQLNKAFENTLAMCEEDGAPPDRWTKISALFPGIDSTEVQKHYERLVNDLNSIDAGRITLPDYGKPYGLLSSSDDDSQTAAGFVPGSGFGGGANVGGSVAGGSGKGSSSSKSSDPERRKGIPWSEEEHRLFLLGLAKFGKGDWRSISRNYVISRTPTQVASHAQKYFIRLNSINNKDKRRSSIHDITSVNDGGDALQPQSPGQPITGLPSPNPAQWPRAGIHGGGVYDMSQMGGPNGDHQMGGQMLMVPAGHSNHVPYGHVPIMQAQPMNMQHMAYTIPQSANA